MQSRFYSTSKEEIRAKAVVGVSCTLILYVIKSMINVCIIQPFTFKAAALFLGVGTGLLLYFQSEKKKVEQLRKFFFFKKKKKLQLGMYKKQ